MAVKGGNSCLMNTGGASDAAVGAGGIRSLPRSLSACLSRSCCARYCCWVRLMDVGSPCGIEKLKGCEHTTLWSRPRNGTFTGNRRTFPAKPPPSAPSKAYPGVLPCGRGPAGSAGVTGMAPRAPHRRRRSRLPGVGAQARGAQSTLQGAPAQPRAPPGLAGLLSPR